MIVSRTPFRVSFAGGGTDLAAYYREEPGAVVSTTINQYMYVTVNRYFDERIIVKYSRTECVERVRDIRHPLIRESLRLAGIERGIEITSMADVVGGTGLGSSSSFTVGLLHALRAYGGRGAAPAALAAEACAVEIERVGEPIGKQDQYIAAHGGLRFIEFLPDESVKVSAIRCSVRTRSLLERSLLLFYTGRTRRASSILKGVSGSARDKRIDLRALRVLADCSRRALERGAVGEFGRLLHEGWLLKRSLHKSISNPGIDAAYARCRRAGAAGGKILGAGGGGFLLLLAPPERQNAVRAALAGWRELKFGFESEGSRIVYDDRKGERK